MAISNSTNLAALGNTLVTHFSKGIRNNLSKVYKEFDFVKSIRSGDGKGAPREFKYLYLNSYGAASVQYRDPNLTYTLPTGQDSAQSEATAIYKALTVTVPFRQDLYERLKSSPDKYVLDRLAKEVEYKEIAMRRQICVDFYGDGSGAIGQIASAAAPASGQVTVTLANTSTSRGFAGNFQYNDQIVNYTTAGVAGVAPTLNSGTFGWFQVTARSAKPSTNTVTLQAYDTTGTARTITAWAPAAGELLYRYNPGLASSNAYPDLTSVSDWGNVSGSIVGLGSLVANDGRVVNGITMSGAIASSISDLGGSTQIDIQYIEELMNEVKNNAGDDWKYNKLLMNRYTKSSLLASRNTDRRFTVAADNQLSVGSLKQAHEADMMEFMVSEFCPFNAVYALPSNELEGNKPLHFIGTDFTTVQGGDPFLLIPGTGAYTNVMHMYMRGHVQLTANHPSAMAKLTGFTTV